MSKQAKTRGRHHAQAWKEQSKPEPCEAAEKKRQQSKIDVVIGLLSRERGASLDELAAATGWQRHTTRAALTRLRQKGQAIGKIKAAGVTRYTIDQVPQP